MNCSWVIPMEESDPNSSEEVRYTEKKYTFKHSNSPTILKTMLWEDREDKLNTSHAWEILVSHCVVGTAETNTTKVLSYNKHLILGQA